MSQSAETGNENLSPLYHFDHRPSGIWESPTLSCEIHNPKGKGFAKAVWYPKQRISYGGFDGIGTYFVKYRIHTQRREDCEFGVRLQNWTPKLSTYPHTQ